MRGGKKDYQSPVVAGAPVTGFVLLITIARHLSRFAKKWEGLLTVPVETIMRLVARAGIDLPERRVTKRIW